MKIILIFAFFAFALGTESLVPESVIVFIGTGARTPLISIKEIENKLPIKWEEGYGQITSSGQRQMYLLGRHFSSVYVGYQNLLPSEFDPSKIYVRSVNKERNLMAAQSFSVGLYKDGGKKLSPEELPDKDLWLPPFKQTFKDYVFDDLIYSATPFDIPSVPIVAYNQTCEKLLSFTECNKFNQQWRDYFKSQKVQDIFAKYKNELTDLCDKTGYNMELLKKDDNFHYFLDYLSAAEFHEKIKDIDGTVIRHIQYEVYEGLFEFTRSVIICNFSEVAQGHFNKAMNKTNGERMLVLETDEMNILGYIFAGGFGKEIIEKKELRPGSSMEIRLIQSDGKYTIDIIYNGVTLKTMSYDEFLKAIESTKDCWSKVCQILCYPFA